MSELDDEQRRWLPSPVPEDLRLVKCTACGSIRVDMPGPGLDPWKDHDLECSGMSTTEDHDE
ncbi:hypothetical protein [Streptomyces sp. NPDC055036]